MLEITFQDLLLRLFSLLVIVPVHGFFLAGAARLLGDRGPGYDGRLTLNPTAHLEWIGGAGFLLFRMGWIRPMAIDPSKLKAGRAGLVLAAVAALAATLFFLFVLVRLRPVVATTIPDIAMVRNISIGLRAVVEGGLWFVALNLLPVPPLTGGLALAAIAPAAHRKLLGWRHYIGVAIVAAALFSIPQAGLEPVRALFASLVGLA